VYRNRLLSDYNDLYHEKNLFAFDDRDERIMYILHNWDRREVSFLYKEQFGTYIYHDFSDFFSSLDTKFYEYITDKHIFFKFPGDDFAAFQLVGLYLDKVSEFYE